MQIKISQVLDIILLGTTLNISPVIFEPQAFRTLTLIMHSFEENKQIKLLLERAIVTFIIYKVLSGGNILRIDFQEYYGLINSNNRLRIIESKLINNNIDLFKLPFREVQLIIEEAFEDVFSLARAS